MKDFSVYCRLMAQAALLNAAAYDTERMAEAADPNPTVRNDDHCARMAEMCRERAEEWMQMAAEAQERAA